MGEMTVGDMTVGDMTVGDMTVGDMTVGDMTVGGMPMDETVPGETSNEAITDDTVPGGRGCTCPAPDDASTPGDGRPVVQRFEVAPAAGGGWDAWSAALHRLLERLTGGLTQCVVVSQGAAGRYVQWMIGHGRIHVEVSSNHYLADPHRLTPAEERHLHALGFRCGPPDATGDTGDDCTGHDSTGHDDTRGGEPRNWSQENELDGQRATARTTALLAHLLEDVALFDPRRPITIEQFLAAQPCAHCSWGDDAP